MIIDIFADSERGAYEYHTRIYAPAVDYNCEQKKLSIQHPSLDIPLFFVNVNLYSVEGGTVTLKGLTTVASGTGEAPKSRIIKISAL